VSEWAEDERLRFEVQGTVHIRVQGLGRARVSPAPFDPTRRTRAPERTEKLRPLTESGNRHSGTENRSKAGIVGLRARKIGVRAGIVWIRVRKIEVRAGIVEKGCGKPEQGRRIGVRSSEQRCGQSAATPPTRNRGSAHDDQALVLGRPSAGVSSHQSARYVWRR
jgi:hypothetical protein